MKKWLALFLAFSGIAHATCVPVTAVPGMIGCWPVVTSMSTTTDYFDIWQPGPFPASANLISPTNVFKSPPPIGSTTPSSGIFTTLSATGTVSGAGITALFAAPPAIGSATPSTGVFTALTANGNAAFNAQFRVGGNLMTFPGSAATLLATTGSGSGLTGITWSQIGSTPTTLAGYGITSPLPQAQGGTAASTLGAATVTANAQTLSLGTLQGWLTGVANPNAVNFVGAGGAITADGSPVTSLSRSGLSANAIWTAIIGGGSPKNYDGLRGVVDVVSGSTLTQANGGGFYAETHADGSMGSNVAVGVAGFGLSLVANGAAWGIATVVADTMSLTGQSLFNEFDGNIYSTSTTFSGIQVTGASLVQPVSAVAFIAESLGTGIYYNSGAFYSANGVANIGFNIQGAEGAPGASIPSQSIYFTAYNSGSSAINATMLLSATGAFSINAPPSGSVLFQINGTTVIDAVTASPASGATGLSLLVNNLGGVNLTQVLLASADGCGTGFKCLKVPN